MMDFSTLVSALQNPEIYPGNPGSVDFRFLDFATAEKRKFYCQQEVILDCQLCPEIYLGVVEIRLCQGRIFFREGPGEIVEYAVPIPTPRPPTMVRSTPSGKILRRNSPSPRSMSGFPSRQNFPEKSKGTPTAR